MTRQRLTPPVCCGRRMIDAGDHFFLNLPTIGLRVVVGVTESRHWYQIETTSMLRVVKPTLATGFQSAANAASRWILNRGKLMQKLAERTP